MTVTTVPLGDLADVVSGGTPKRSEPSYFGGDIPWVKIGDMRQGTVTGTEESITSDGLGGSSAKLLPAGTVLLSIFATIGRTAVLGLDAATNQAIAGVKIKDSHRVDRDYLRRHLEHVSGTLARQGRGVAQANINLSILRSHEVPLPAIDEQRRIAAVLDAADEVRVKRHQALGKLDTLTQTIFVDMFGDPVSNTRGWQTGKLSCLGNLDRGVSKHRPRNDPSLLGGQWPLIQTGDVAKSGGYIRDFVSTYSDAGLAQSKLWPVGTLCVTIAANIAKTGILTFEACFPDSVVGFATFDEPTTEYVRALFSFLQPILEAQAPESAQKNINLKVLRGLEVPIPPTELRADFSRALGQALCSQMRMAEQIQRLDLLYASIQQRAFKGEL